MAQRVVGPILKTEKPVDKSRIFYGTCILFSIACTVLAAANMRGQPRWALIVSFAAIIIHSIAFMVHISRMIRDANTDRARHNAEGIL